jgi:AbrB family looped-hinge helix DNA binding protein
MSYTHNITTKGQITIPKAFRQKLGLDEIGKATIELNERNEIVLTRPKSLDEVRALLRKPSLKDAPSEKEVTAGRYLAKKYGVR